MRMCIYRCAGADEASVGQALEHLLRAGLQTAEYERLRAVGHVGGRAASVGARLALLRLLTDAQEQLTAYGMDSLPPVKGKPLAALCRTEQGTPYLADGDVAISFAHSDRLSVCVLAHGGRIGVDVEPFERRIMRTEEIAARYFSEGERALLARADDTDSAFLRIWTRKEALGKALGTGLNAEPERLDTTAYPDDCFVEWTLEEHIITTCVLK